MLCAFEQRDRSVAKRALDAIARERNRRSGVERFRLWFSIAPMASAPEGAAQRAESKSGVPWGKFAGWLRPLIHAGGTPSVDEVRGAGGLLDVSRTSVKRSGRSASPCDSP